MNHWDDIVNHARRKQPVGFFFKYFSKKSQLFLLTWRPQKAWLCSQPQRGPSKQKQVWDAAVYFRINFGFNSLAVEIMVLRKICLLLQRWKWDSMWINDSNSCNDISLGGMSIPSIKKVCPLIKIFMERCKED